MGCMSREILILIYYLWFMSQNWELAEHIHELIRQEEIVVIPHFGAFVSDQESAKIDQLVIRPPQKKIIFNKNVIKDDGVLNKWISQVLKQEYLQSKLTIAEAVFGWRKALAYGEKVSFENIGELELNKDGQIVFEGYKNNTLQGEFFGLDIINLPQTEKAVETVKEAEPILVSAPKEEKKVIQLDPQLNPKKEEAKVIEFASPKKKNTRLGKIAVVMAPILSISLGFWGASELDKENNLASLFSSSKEVKIENTSPDLTVKKVFKAADFFSKEELAHIKEPKNTLTDKIEVKNTKVVSEVYKHHIIAGCFSYLSNAKNLVSTLQNKGFEARLIGQTKKGLYRVSYSSYKTRKQALLGLARIKMDENKSSWLLNESISLEAATK